jgi:hypothetical protein
LWLRSPTFPPFLPSSLPPSLLSFSLFKLTLTDATIFVFCFRAIEASWWSVCSALTHDKRRSWVLEN